MYESFYGLSCKPFSTVPDPDFLYLSKGHELALTMLRYGLMTSAPVTVITGEIGAGKTTLLRQVMNEMPGDLTVGLISNFQTGRGELLEWILMSLGQPFEATSYVRLYQAFENYVVQSYAEGRRVVLIFDEAQNLGLETLEELRLLSNINADGHQLLQLMLVGQPQLRALLNHPDLVQFAQRVSSDFHLDALTLTETEGYIARRLEVAGARAPIFTARTCALIHHATGGMPRLINTLCDLCLVHGFSAERLVIDEEVLRAFLDSAQKHAVFRQFRPLPGPDGADDDTATDHDPAAGDARTDPAQDDPARIGPARTGEVVSWLSRHTE